VNWESFVLAQALCLTDPTVWSVPFRFPPAGGASHPNGNATATDTLLFGSLVPPDRLPPRCHTRRQ